MTDIVERLRAKLGPLVEDRICVLCGRTEPCMTDEEAQAAGGPGAPCTFDPTAQQLWDTNVRLRAELAAAKALLREASKTLIEVARMPNQEHVADAHNETVKRIRAALGDDPASPSSNDKPQQS